MKIAPGLNFRGSIGWKDRVLLRDLDFAARPGEWTCLLGASGVGKSTLLRLFAGLDDGIQFDGTLSDVSGQVAMMAQSDALLPWLTVLDNVLIGARLRGETADRSRGQDLLIDVGLGDHSHKRPHELSGGQRQRVALARVLMEDRPIVLLDEPFSALDALTRSQMQDLAAGVLRGKTVLMVTHDPNEAVRLGHRIIILTQQSLEAIEPPTGDIPRGIEAEDVLRIQAGLLQKLRTQI